MATMHLVSVLRDCLDKCNEPSFRVPTVCKDLENYVAILRFLVLAFQQVGLLIDSLDEGSLFPSLEGDYSVHDGFFKGLESLDASCFYGRSFGFQVSFGLFNTILIMANCLVCSIGDSHLQCDWNVSIDLQFVVGQYCSIQFVVEFESLFVESRAACQADHQSNT